MKLVSCFVVICTVLCLFALGFVSNNSVIADDSAARVITLELVNINAASVRELMKLPGIGRKKAESIVAFRDKNGDFEHIDEIKKVDGIGEKTFEMIRERIAIK